MAAVDGKLVRNWTGGRHFLENAQPDTALGPTIVAVVDGRRWPKGWRNVAPAASCFQYMQDAGNDSPIPWAVGGAIVGGAIAAAPYYYGYPGYGYQPRCWVDQ